MPKCTKLPKIVVSLGSIFFKIDRMHSLDVRCWTFNVRCSLISFSIQIPFHRSTAELPALHSLKGEGGTPVPPERYALRPMHYAFPFRIPTSAFHIQITIFNLAWFGPMALAWVTSSCIISANWIPSLAPIQVNLSRSWSKPNWGRISLRSLTRRRALKFPLI